MHRSFEMRIRGVLVQCAALVGLLLVVSASAVGVLRNRRAPVLAADPATEAVTDPSGVMPSVDAQRRRQAEPEEKAFPSANDLGTPAAVSPQSDGMTGGTATRDGATGGEDTLSEAEEIEARIKDLEGLKTFVRGHVDNMHALIRQEAARLEAEQQRRREALKAHEKKEKLMAMKESVNLGQITARLRKRRKEINKCLMLIHGGSAKLYWSLRKKFAKIPSGQVCIAFKAMAFPHIPMVGFTENLYKKYIHWSPPTDGSTVRYFDAVKTNVFRCMCEEPESKMSPKEMDAAAKGQSHPAVDNIEKLSAKYSDEIAQQLKEDRLRLLHGLPIKHDTSHPWLQH